jgi:hypothetical protein
MHDNKQCVSIMSLLCQFRVRGFCMALGATLLVWLAFQDGIEAAQATDEDFLDAYKATILRDYEAAHNGLLPLAEAGHPAAAYHLSQLYWNGHGVKRNAATAIFWLKSAARGNYAQAQLELAIVYESGIGLTADYREAAKWMAKAAAAGVPDAEFFLGHYYREGKGLIQDDVQAYTWIRRSVERGAGHYHFLDGLFYLGAAHEWARGVPRDLVDAYKWFALAAAYSRDASEQHIEAGRAMGALSTRISRSEINAANRLAEEWQTKYMLSARAEHEPAVIGNTSE